MLFNGTTITEWDILPLGAHSARPYRDGILFNDTVANLVRYITPDAQCAFKVPMYADERLTHTDFDDSLIARQGFGRGLCVMDNGIIAAGSSPSTITFHNIDKRGCVLVIRVQHDDSIGTKFQCFVVTGFLIAAITAIPVMPDNMVNI